jgi:hypothetical protein
LVSLGLLLVFGFELIAFFLASAIITPSWY